MQPQVLDSQSLGQQIINRAQSLAAKDQPKSVQNPKLWAAALFFVTLSSLAVYLMVSFPEAF